MVVYFVRWNVILCVDGVHCTVVAVAVVIAADIDGYCEMGVVWWRWQQRRQRQLNGKILRPTQMNYQRNSHKFGMISSIESSFLWLFLQLYLLSFTSIESYVVKACAYNMNVQPLSLFYLIYIHFMWNPANCITFTVIRIGNGRNWKFSVVLYSDIIYVLYVFIYLSILFGGISI